MELIGIDLGGTQIKGVMTNLEGDILDETSTPTLDIAGMDNSAVWKASVKKMIDRLSHKMSGTPRYIGISSPGTVNDNYSGVISNGSKLLGIEDFIWSDYLGQEVCVLNDAHAALYAESQLGAGRNYKNILMITLGTGVGGGIMINRQLLRGIGGRAGHIGHISVNQNHDMGIVNTPGSLENSIGECSLKSRTYGHFASTKDLIEAHMSGDDFATWTWLNSVQSLARGIVSFINILSPEIIIIGGGIAKSEALLMSPLSRFLEIYEWRPKGLETPIVFAQLDNNAGSVGAALFAFNKLNNNSNSN